MYRHLFNLFLSVCASALMFTAADDTTSKLQISLLGFDTEHKISLIRKILNISVETLGSDKDFPESLEQPGVQLQFLFSNTDELDSPIYSDIAFCYLDRSTLLDQDRAIGRILQSLARPLEVTVKSDSNTTDSTVNREKPIFLVYEGASEDHNTLNVLASTAIRVERTLAGPSLWLSEDQESVKPRLLLLPVGAEQQSDETLDTFRNAVKTHVQKVLETKVPNAVVSTPAHSNQSRSRAAGLTSSVRGIDRVESAVQRTLSGLRQSLAQDQRRLAKLPAGAEFSAFLEDLVRRSETALLMQHLTEADAQVRSLATQQWRRQAAADLKPLFVDKLDRLTQQTLVAFNEVVAADIEISISIMKELGALRDKQLRHFLRTATASLPVSYASVWTETVQAAHARLQRVFEDYLLSRQQSLQSQLLLPRPGRVPLELSLHWLLLHPLGRDHRQAPLGTLSDEELLFDPQLALCQRSLPLLSETSQARKALRHRLAEEPETNALPRLVGLQSDLQKRSEFAREMLMLPLSLKHPAVPMGGRGRARRSSVTQSSQQVLERYRTSVPPQKMLLLDPTVAPELGEVQLGLEQAAQLLRQQNEGDDDQGFMRSLDEALNLLPRFRADFYRHPPLNYAAKSVSAASSS